MTARDILDSDPRVMTQAGQLQDDTDALDDLLSLRGVSYEYIDPGAINELTGTRIGMIARVRSTGGSSEEEQDDEPQLDERAITEPADEAAGEQYGQRQAQADPERDEPARGPQLGSAARA